MHFFKFLSAGACHLTFSTKTLYPFVNATCLYPLGHPDTIFVAGEEGCLFRKHDDPDTLRLIEKEIIGEKLFGVIKCRVLPNRNLHIPVLPLSHAGKLYFPLCRKCVTENSVKQILSMEACFHSKDERSYWGTFCTPELKLALENGYKLMDVSECWSWSQQNRSNQLFKRYINAFLKVKAESSGWPESVVQAEASGNDEEAQRLKDVYIKEFENKEGVKLRCNCLKRIF